MRYQRRALVGLLAAVLLSASMASCTRGGLWGRRTTTTTRRPTTTQPGTPVSGRYVEPVFEDIEQIASGVAFKGDLEFDAWAPAGDTETKRPAIVWSFGGAFIAGNRQSMNRYAQDSARRGYVGITVDYRLQASISTILTGIYDGYDDTIAAGEYLKEHADEYGIDPDALIIGGFSAGGINAVNAIVLPGQRGPATSPYIAAISNSGASVGAIVGAVAGGGGGGTGSSRPGQGPIIMWGGTTDTIVSYQNWQVPTCEQHKRAGNVCEMLVYEGQGHGVISSIPDALNKSMAFVKREALAELGY